MIQTCFSLRPDRFDPERIAVGLWQKVDHVEARPNLFESFYSEFCFGFEFCNLGFICNLSFVIWDLKDFI